MHHAVSPFGVMLSIICVSVGILYLWYLKNHVRKNIKMDSFNTFFLGGARIGERLTTNDNWGLCFAFANAIWYYSYLGYYFGLYVFLIQLSWSIGVVFIAWQLQRYLAGSKDGTVHGFISHTYGVRASLLAAIATLIGYTLNIGFEIFYSAHLLVTSLGGIKYELLLAISIAIFVGGYCIIGGYLSNVVSDPLQNKLALFSQIAIIGLLIFYFPTIIQKSSISAMLTVSKTIDAPTSFIIGVITFSFFFNLVDMANWQSMAANKDVPREDLKKVKVGFIVSAARQMIAPAALGTLFGAALRVVSSGVPDDGYFAVLFKPLSSSMSPVTGILLGIIILGFFAATITSAGSYLIAAMQTLAVDVFKRKEAVQLKNSGINPEQLQEAEQLVLAWVKRMMIPVVLAMTLVFAFLYYGLSRVNMQGLAFQFQFVMYGAAVSLVPSVIYGLFHKAPVANRSAGFWSILIGLIFVIIPFIMAEVFRNIKLPLNLGSDDIVNLTPLFGLIASTGTFYILKGTKVEKHASAAVGGA